MKNIIFILLALPLFLSTVSASSQIITTIAGTYSSEPDTILGDGGPAINANLEGPYAVALDGKGNYYITDGYNNRIRKVNSAGIITTIAGTGTQGYNGDNIPATDAQIYRPVGITFDHYGNLYFCDAFNNRVRKIDTTGIITTVAGDGGSIYNGDNILADSATVYNPSSMVIDAHGDIYVTDYGNHRIRKVNASGIITTIAGTGIAGNNGDNGSADTARINGPYGIVLDDTGNIYFADIYENVIRKIDTSGIITTFAGGGSDLGDNGPADSANLNGPAGLAIDADNNIYIADADNMRIRKVTISSGIITTVAGDGTEGFSGDGGPAVDAELNEPTGIAIDPTNTIYIADFGNDLIRRVGWPENVNNLITSSQTFTVYPNPGTTQITITGAVKITDVTISNLLGQTVYYQLSDAETLQLNIADLPSGIYFVIVNDTQVKKFIKE